ncbi:hypothetical protein E3P99_00185 [Wallemia hederae]|uniref:Uncharacterized protein n=1 Tax=Wallemia hederae TaxID=1540922 RepID=A0A4T0FYD0_9BASI|nr:hypothetical protein E3P99_00185 [Wallemia hederae]
MRATRILRNTNLNLKHQNFVKPTLETFGVFKSIFKWSSFFSLVGLVGTLATFEGVNQYVEFTKLDKAASYQYPPPDDADEWSIENDDWSGGLNGGTESSLPWKAAHLIRSAWIALEWGVGTASSAASLNPSLDMSQSYLLSAITHVEAAHSVKNKDAVLNALYLRLADIRQRAGTRVSLNNALDGYEQVHSFLVAHSAPTAMIIKVEKRAGDVCKALGLDKESERWYLKGLSRVSTPQKTNASNTSYLPSWLTRRPQLDSHVDASRLSPAQFRAYVDTLLSLSRLYATSNRLSEASTIQKRLVNVLTKELESVKGLQGDWIRHSLALSEVHLAEVTYAISHKNLHESLGWLQDAEHLSLSANKSVSGVYASDAYRKRQAHKLTSASRRTAAECAYLSGMLHQSRNDTQRALGCFERAIKYALQVNSLTKDLLDSLANDPLNRKYLDAYKNVRN